jgi:hypothetical protein
MRLHRSVVAGFVAAPVTAMAVAFGGVGLADTRPASTETVRAASTAPTPTTPAALAAEPGPGHPGPGKHGLSRLLHGQFVVPREGGGHQTVLVQRGSVTASSMHEVSVRSADGYRQTYVIGSDTLVNSGPGGARSLESGDSVFVVATRTDGTWRAVHVSDLSMLRSVWGRHGMGGSGMGGSGR